jgi:hypothetical protein
MTEGVEQRFGDFAEFVATRHSEYGLGATRSAVRRSFLGLVRRLDAEPLVTAAGAVTGAHLRIGLLAPLYADAAFPLGARLLAAARDGDATVAGAVGAEPQLWYDDDNTASAQMAVFCADGAWPHDPAVYAAQARADAARYPLTGGAGAAIWPCAFWPSDPIDPPIRATGRGRPNVLLINNLRDPATTYGAAAALRRQLGERARLVGVDRGGHGAYLGNQNACAQRVGTDFLVHGARPVRDLLCPAKHAALRGALEHLTAVQHVPGALAEIRDDAGTTELSSGFADVRSGQAPTSSDRVRIFSNTKTFVATVVLQLSAEGRVTLDAPVERYPPGLIRGNGNDGREISVRQLLSHTTPYCPATASPSRAGAAHRGGASCGGRRHAHQLTTDRTAVTPPHRRQPAGQSRQAHRPGTGRGLADRPSPNKQRNRHRAVHLPRHGENPYREHPTQNRRP